MGKWFWSVALVCVTVVTVVVLVLLLGPTHCQFSP